MAYEAACALDRGARSFVRSPSNPRAALSVRGEMDDERALLVGTKRVFLRPCAEGRAPRVRCSRWLFGRGAEGPVRFEDTGGWVTPRIPRRSAGASAAACVGIGARLRLGGPTRGALPTALVKTTAQDAAQFPSSQQGFASGQRSALVFGPGARALFRVKGAASRTRASRCAEWGTSARRACGAAC